MQFTPRERNVIYALYEALCEGESLEDLLYYLNSADVRWEVRAVVRKRLHELYDVQGQHA